MNKESSISSSEKKNEIEMRRSEEEVNLNFEMEVEPLKSRFKMETIRSEEENLNFEMEFDTVDARFKLENSSSEKETKEEEEEEEYVCCICGFLGSKFLDSFECSSTSCNQEFAHRYCVLKNKDDELLKKPKAAMSVELSELFKYLTETETSVIDHFILSVEDFIMKKKQKQKQK